jgi:restriction system protein
MIPEFQSFFNPFLELCSDNKEHSLNEMRDYLTKYFSLTEEDKAERVPSGVQTKFDNRIYWTKSYFIKANLIENIRRSVFKITEKGIDFFKKHNSNISIGDLKTINEFREFSLGNPQLHGETIDKVSGAVLEAKTPEEILEDSFFQLKIDLADEIIDKIKNCTPSFFEGLVVDLLLKMGYGGSIKDAGKIIGKSGDGGIDGIIKEDKLGLDTIYVQAKRWEKTVPISQIRDFAGSLLSKKAKKGIFISTSNYPKGAYDFVSSIEPKIVLIDGKELADLMIEHGVGVSTKVIYEVRKIDSDYFEEI